MCIHALCIIRDDVCLNSEYRAFGCTWRPHDLLHASAARTMSKPRLALSRSIPTPKHPPIPSFLVLTLQTAIGKDHLLEIPVQQLVQLSLGISVAARGRRLAQQQPSVVAAAAAAAAAAVEASSGGVDQLRKRQRQRDGAPRSKACLVTLGDWCRQYKRQVPLQYKTTPRGSKQCLNNCSGVGNCNYDIGVCDCPAGAVQSTSTVIQYSPGHAVLLRSCSTVQVMRLAMMWAAAIGFIPLMHGEVFTSVSCCYEASSPPLPFAGWTGQDCTTMQLRPCSHTDRKTGNVTMVSLLVGLLGSDGFLVLDLEAHASPRYSSLCA